MWFLRKKYVLEKCEMEHEWTGNKKPSTGVEIWKLELSSFAIEWPDKYIY
jgi:hypothetical protein